MDGKDLCGNTGEFEQLSQSHSNLEQTAPTEAEATLQRLAKPSLCDVMFDQKMQKLKARKPKGKKGNIRRLVRKLREAAEGKAAKSPREQHMDQIRNSNKAAG